MKLHEILYNVIGISFTVLFVALVILLIFLFIKIVRNF